MRGLPPLSGLRAPARHGVAAAAGLALALLLGCGSGPAPVLEVSGPAEGGLVFVRVDARGGKDLWRARLSDGAVRPLRVTPERDESWPYWSPAAGLLVFEIGSEQERWLRLWRASDATELALPDPGAKRQSWAAWGPRGQRLAYALKASPTSSGLAVRAPEAGESSLWALNRGGVSFFRPAFAPVGDALVAQGRAAQTSRIYRLAPGRFPVPLTPASVFAYRPDVTRDGQWCLFTDRGRGGAPNRIAAVRLDGSGLVGLAGGPDVHNERAKASPSRDEIAFVSDRDGQLDVFRMEFPDGEPRNLTRALDLDAGPLVWSPDGERLAVVMKPAGGGRSMSEKTSDVSTWLVVVIDREGRELFRTPGHAPHWMPAWP